MAAESRKVIIAALIGNLMVAITKFFAAAFTGSSAMFSEAIHSVVDTGNQGMMLYGLKRPAFRLMNASPSVTVRKSTFGALSLPL